MKRAAFPFLLSTKAQKARKFVSAFFWIQILLAIGFFSRLINFVSDDYNFLGGMALFGAFAILVPWLFSLHPRFGSQINQSFLVFTEASIGIAIMLSWIGTFGLYLAGFGYDSFVHFIVSVILAILVFLFLAVVWQGFRNGHFVFGFILIILVVTMLGGVINELFEYYGDIIFGTMMYGEPGQMFDTRRDFIYDFLGSIFGISLVVWNRERLVGKFINNIPS